MVLCILGRGRVSPTSFGRVHQRLAILWRRLDSYWEFCTGDQALLLRLRRSGKSYSSSWRREDKQYLVQNVECWYIDSNRWILLALELRATPNVLPIAFNNIYQVICRRPRFPDSNICITYLKFTQNTLDIIVIKIRQRDRIRNSDPTLILLAYNDSRWFFVQADSESFEFGFNDGFIP